MDCDRGTEVTIVESPVFNGVRCVDSVAASETPKLATTKVIVAGGRGIGAANNLELIAELARALDGAVGVSLPVVEAGWAPRSMQVGQTGTVVHPSLYIACGISEPFQHKIGVERSQTIIAINTDRDAPILEFHDMAVIGDLKTLLPHLSALIRKRRASN